MVNELTTIRSDCPDVAMLCTQYGTDDGRVFRDSIRRILIAGGLSPEATLADLQRLLRIRVCFHCTDLIRGATVVLDADSAPTMLVADAVYASCCIPFLFLPLKWGEWYLVDGCLTDALPRSFPEKSCLYVHTMVYDVHRTPPSSWIEYIQAIMHATNLQQREALYDLQTRIPKRCITLLTPSVVQHTPAFDFKMSPRRGCFLQHCGFALGYDWIHEHVPSETLGRLTKVLVHANFLDCEDITHECAPLT